MQLPKSGKWIHFTYWGYPAWPSSAKEISGLPVTHRPLYSCSCRCPGYSRKWYWSIWYYQLPECCVGMSLSFRWWYIFHQVLFGKFLAEVQQIIEPLSHKLKMLSKWVQVLHQCLGDRSSADLKLANLDALRKVVMKMPQIANHLTTGSPHRVSIPSDTLL